MNCGLALKPLSAHPLGSDRSTKSSPASTSDALNRFGTDQARPYRVSSCDLPQKPSNFATGDSVGAAKTRKGMPFNHRSSHSSSRGN